MENILNKFLRQIGLDRKGHHPQSIKNAIQHRPMPAELLNEVFIALPLDNAFEMLAKMPNGLLARTVRKMLESVKTTLKYNKWNPGDCGPKLRISEGGLKVKHSGPNEYLNCIRAKLPIPMKNLNVKKQSIPYYFEVEILQPNSWLGSTRIGFCTKQFPLEDGWLGRREHSIGFFYNGGICIDGSYFKFGNSYEDLQVGDVIGLGIVRSTASSLLQCFATCNGKLLGIVELPAKFDSLQLFPAVNLYRNGNAIRANFGKDKWRFVPRKIYQHDEK